MEPVCTVSETFFRPEKTRFLVEGSIKNEIFTLKNVLNGTAASASTLRNILRPRLHFHLESKLEGWKFCTVSPRGGGPSGQCRGSSIMSVLPGSVEMIAWNG